MADVAFAAAQTDFAVGLLREAAVGSNASLILSPISIALALSLAYAGAGGDTRREFERVFARGGIPGDTLDLQFHRSFAQLTAAHRNVLLELANRAYVEHEVEVKAAYKETIEQNFGGNFEQVDFRRPAGVAAQINAFVTNATHQKIRDLLSSEAIHEKTRLLLVNALYFKGVWDEPFAGRSTGKETFFIAENNEQQVDLPRFKIESQFELKELLQKLGFSEAFEKTANFSGISDELLYVSKGVHKTFIEVKEKETEAAAATAILMPPYVSARWMGFEELVSFRADHPFAFLVTYEKQPLFFGRYTGPSL
ncbi:SERPIN domain-containing protein [Aphelenchoides fujianensis]|nr:SERPIN domain-containing protein [Aphelenchoides fujianensis]